LEEPVLATLVERNELAALREHDLAIAQKEEQQKEHDGESKQRIERPQKKRSAEPGGALQYLLGAGHQPALQLGCGDACVLLQPIVDASDPGELLQIRKRLDVPLSGRLLYVLQETGYLRYELDGERRQGQQNRKGREERQQSRGYSLAAQSATPTNVERKQQKCEECSPAHGAEQRRKYQHQCVAQYCGHDERKNPRIEVRFGHGGDQDRLQADV
jgi:hypothetical protein